MPSEYFRRQVYATHWFETVPLRKLLDDLPVDRLLFETDFPHPTCLYEDVAGRVEAGFGALDPELRRKLLWGNAADLYGVADPTG
jgi:predicted TIM-barrel fold metal-dependent hydrolase